MNGSALCRRKVWRCNAADELSGITQTPQARDAFVTDLLKKK